MKPAFEDLWVRMVEYEGQTFPKNRDSMFIYKLKGKELSLNSMS